MYCWAGTDPQVAGLGGDLGRLIQGRCVYCWAGTDPQVAGLGGDLGRLIQGRCVYCWAGTDPQVAGLGGDLGRLGGVGRPGVGQQCCQLLADGRQPRLQLCQERVTGHLLHQRTVLLVLLQTSARRNTQPVRDRDTQLKNEAARQAW